MNDFVQDCVGRRSCRIGVSADTFGDPCSGITNKSLAVEALCTWLDPRSEADGVRSL